MTAVLAMAWPAAAGQSDGQYVLVVKRMIVVEIRDARQRIVKHDEDNSVEGKQLPSLPACQFARDRRAKALDAEEEQRESLAIAAMRIILAASPETSLWIPSISIDTALDGTSPAAALAIGRRPAE